MLPFDNSHNSGQNSEEKANLDRQVLSLLDNLLLDGSGKDLIPASKVVLPASTKAETTSVKTTSPHKGSATIEKRLAKLKELLGEGLLTPDEAAAKRREILKGL